MKKYLIITLIIIEGIFCFLAFKSYGNKVIELDDVKLKNEIVTKKAFAIMIEQSDGTYTESQSNTFPTSGYDFNLEKSGCVDDNDEIVPNVLSYSNNKVMLNTTKTVYCYVYFDIETVVTYYSSYEAIGDVYPHPEIISDSDYNNLAVWKRISPNDNYVYYYSSQSDCTSEIENSETCSQVISSYFAAEMHKTGVTGSGTARACLNLNGITLCSMYNDWTITETIKEQFEDVGFVCKFYDSDGSTWSLSVKPTNGYMRCSETNPESMVSDEKYCDIKSNSTSECGIKNGGHVILEGRYFALYDLYGNSSTVGLI